MSRTPSPRRRGGGPLLILALGMAALVAAGPAALTGTVPVAAVAAASAEQDTGVADHSIRRIVVDDVASRWGVQVRHEGSDWSGAVRIGFDVSGGPRAEFRAVIRRGSERRDRFERSDGSPWRCASRVADSAPDGATTVLEAARRCFGDPQRLRARARVDVLSADETTTVPRPATRPNVVLIMLDDMRDDDLQFMPLTQSLIADQGVRFMNSLAPYPLCCPARASVLTGQYAHNHRVWSHMPPWGFSSFNDRSTLATWMQDAGYHTTYLGKYLNGYGVTPPFGQTSGNSTRYVPPGWSDWRASIDGGLPPGHPKNGGSYRYMDTTLADNGDGFDAYPRRYQTRVYGALTERIIADRAASEAPFFLHVSYTAPHRGLPRDPDDPAPVLDDAGHEHLFPTPMVPRQVRGRFDHLITEAPGAGWFDQPHPPFDRPAYLAGIVPMNAAEKDALREVARQRAEALSVVDEQVASTIEALSVSGELDQTLVMLTSDNGFFLGEQGIRHGKVLPHEPSIRTPLVMRGPGIPAGEVRYDPFLSIDFAPTIADATGVTPGGPVDGMSMLPVARDGDRGWTRAVLTETGQQGTVRATDEAGEPLDVDDPGTADIRYAIGVRSDRYLYVHLADGDEELYDMAVDPTQHHNFAGDPSYAPVLDLLRVQLRRIQACDEAQCQAQLPTELATAPGESIRNQG